ncbi:MAG TPA: proprotein convertase P-domain-containing protein [Haloferula sp.]
MKNFASSLVAACLSLPALAGVEEPPPKTNSSLPIDENLLTVWPYSLNGVVGASGVRGSGFIAQHPNLFITAAHVLYDGGWKSAPTWSGQVNSLDFPAVTGITSRGYFRWASYSDEVTSSGRDSPDAFKRDVALAWSFIPFTSEEPATLDYQGASHLRSGIPSMITGYPALIDYTGAEGNYLLHTTREETTSYKGSGNYLTATHISTGPGNSGGPVWVRGDDGNWKAGGILVSGRPSEDGLNGFTSEIKTLFKAAEPVLADPVRDLIPAAKVGSSLRMVSLKKPKTIPDGRPKWTRVPLNIGNFPQGATIDSVTLNLTITTDHIGDLVVSLVGPDGTSVLLHNSQGAGANDLVFDNEDLSSAFSGTSAGENGVISGKWQLYVQDRLTGDIATVTRFQLEVGIHQ